jgi:hypothetical protein
MTIAMLLTVKDEQRLLRDNILYHRHLGVDEFHVFFDDDHAPTRACIADLPFVHTHAPAQVEGALREAECLTRKRTNTQALLAELGDRDGWLIELDPDELLCLDFERVEAGALRRRLDSIPAGLAQVNFSVFEVVQLGGGSHAFAGRWWKSLFRQEGGRVAQARLPYRVYDPFSDLAWWQNGYYGHIVGKSALRLGTPARAWTHFFTRPDGGPLPTATADPAGPPLAVLHYYCFDFEDTWKKFRLNYGGGIGWDERRVRRPIKRLWHRVFQMLPPERAREYYDTWIRYTEEYVVRELERADSGVFEIAAVARYFTGGQAAGGPDGRESKQGRLGSNVRLRDAVHASMAEWVTPDRNWLFL